MLHFPFLSHTSQWLPLSPFILSTIRTERNTKQNKLNRQHTQDVVKGSAFNYSFLSRPQGHRQSINFFGRQNVPLFSNRVNTTQATMIQLCSLQDLIHLQQTPLAAWAVFIAYSSLQRQKNKCAESWCITLGASQFKHQIFALESSGTGKLLSHIPGWTTLTVKDNPSFPTHWNQKLLCWLLVDFSSLLLLYIVCSALPFNSKYSDTKETEDEQVQKWLFLW